jgi:hypothetical protein
LAPFREQVTAEADSELLIICCQVEIGISETIPTLEINFASISWVSKAAANVSPAPIVSIRFTESAE